MQLVTIRAATGAMSKRSSCQVQLPQSTVPGPGIPTACPRPTPMQCEERGLGATLPARYKKAH